MAILERFKHEKTLGKSMKNLSALRLSRRIHSITHDTRAAWVEYRARWVELLFSLSRDRSISRVMRSIIGWRYRTRRIVSRIITTSKRERQGTRHNYFTRVSICVLSIYLGIHWLYYIFRYISYIYYSIYIYICPVNSNIYIYIYKACVLFSKY